MNRLIGIMIIVMSGIFLFGQIKAFKEVPTAEEITQRRMHLMSQLEHLHGTPEEESFTKVIMKEIKKLDEQKFLLTKKEFP